MSSMPAGAPSRCPEQGSGHSFHFWKGVQDESGQAYLCVESFVKEEPLQLGDCVVDIPRGVQEPLHDTTREAAQKGCT